VYKRRNDPQNRIISISSTHTQIFSYVDDDVIWISERYKLLEKKNSMDGLQEIYQLKQGNFPYFDYGNSIVALVQRDSRIQLEFYGVAYYNNQEMNAPGKILMLDELPSNFHIGRIEGHLFYDDIVLEMKDHWRILISPYDFDETNEFIEYRIPYPTGITKTHSVLFQADSAYPLLIAVQSEAGNDTAFIALAKMQNQTGQTIVDYNNPLLVTIDGKSSYGLDSYLFPFNDGVQEPVPLLIIGNRLHAEPSQSNAYVIYKLRKENLTQPQFIQFFTPPISLFSNDEKYYLNYPILADDFNADGITDILFSMLTGPGGPYQKVVGFYGQPQTTAIPAREWLRQD
jgi:hypothetical protein